jgi:hypothetical protein
MSIITKIGRSLFFYDCSDEDGSNIDSLLTILFLGVTIGLNFCMNSLVLNHPGWTQN